MASNVDGLVSGMDTTTIISQLMQLERQPVVRLEARKTQVNAVIAIYQQLNTKFAALSSAGSALARTSDWQAMKASSSDTGAVTATATSSAQPGSLSFTVAQLSRAGAVASSGTVVSPNVVVTSGPFLVSKGADLLGFAQLEAGTGLSLGAHTVEVTQSSAGAVKDGASPVAAGFAFTGPATIGVEVDGVADTWQLSGTYASAAELAAAVESASGGAVTASLDESGALRLESAHEGSAATLRVTSVGAEAATALGLTVDGAAASGTDGYVSVDGAAAVAVSSVKAGQATSFAGGTLQAVFAGGLRAGTVAATNVDTGTGTLEALVAAVNRAGAGVSAVAVRVGTDSYRLQLSSTTTGAGSNVTVGAGDLSGLGSFTTVQAGRDAKIVIGEGPGAYEVSSATDTVAGVLDGVTFSLQRADPGTSVTVAVARDGEALAERVKALVDAANGALTHIKSHSGYDPATNKAGALLSDGKARLLTDQVLRAVSDAVGQSSLASAGRAGVSVARDGSVTFDRAKFLEAYAADPEAVEALFQQGGTATSSAVSFVSATAKAQAGTYAVDITTAAEQARIVGTDLAGSPLAGSETISVRVGGASGTTVSYSAQAGSTLADVVDGLNAAFAGGGLALTATIEGGALAILTAAYGTAAGFEVASDNPGPTGISGAAAAGQWVLREGVDVAGTIDGRTATGAGQLLTVSGTDTVIPGLALLITETDPNADLGAFEYQPGVAQRLHSAAAAAIEFGTGSISTAISGRQDLIRDLDSRIKGWDARLAKRELNLRRQFSALEVALGKLRDQSSWLAGQLAGLPANNSQ